MTLCVLTPAMLLALLPAALPGTPPGAPVSGSLPESPAASAAEASAGTLQAATGAAAVTTTATRALNQAGGPASTADLSALLTELSRSPRVVGTVGYERGLDRVEAALRAAGLRPERLEVETARAIPTRSEVLLFDDAIASVAFAGLKERWEPEASPSGPLPAAYAWNASATRARGPVVELGAGLERDFAEAEGLRLTLEGTVALVTVPAAPVNRKTSLRAIATRAASRGCVGVLVAPLRRGATRDDFVLVDVRPALGGASADLVLPLPCAPIRSVEAGMLRSRLKVRRVRGANGKATTIRVGPGPVEVSLTIECPVTQVKASALRLDVPSKRAETLHLVSSDQRTSLALGGAPALAVAVGAAAALGPPNDADTATLWFGPHDAARPPGLGAPGLRLDAVLAPRPGTPVLARFGALGPSRLPPRLDESEQQLASRLAGQLGKRMAAAVRWVAYSVTGADLPRKPSGARAARGHERLLEPLPSER